MGSSLLTCLRRRKQNKTPLMGTPPSPHTGVKTSQIAQHTVPAIPNQALQMPLVVTSTSDAPNTTAYQDRQRSKSTKVALNKGKNKATLTTPPENPAPLPTSYQETRHQGKKTLPTQSGDDDVEYDYAKHDELVQNYRESLLDQRVIDGQLDQYRASLLAEQGKQLPSHSIPTSFYGPPSVPSSYYRPTIQQTPAQQQKRQYVWEKDNKQNTIWRAGHTYK